MFLSIVIPLYNKEASVAAAIRSVLAQGHRDYELIIVDDGSTDQSLAAAREVRDPRIRIVEKANGGVGSARNEGVRLARGEWVAFLDADDEYLPGFLEGMAAFVARHQGRISFAACNLLYGATGRSSFPELPTGVYNYFDLCRHSETPATSSSTVVSRRHFQLAGGFPEGMRQYEDWTMWCKLAFLGEFGFVAAPLSCYHLPGAGTASTSARPPAELWNDLMVLPATVEAWLAAGGGREEKGEAARRYLNRYLLGQARVLRRKGERRLAWRLLREVRWRHLERRLLVTTLFLMLLPRGLKRGGSALLERLRGRRQAPPQRPLRPEDPPGIEG